MAVILLGFAAVIAMAVCYNGWQNSQRIVISESSAFRIQLPARPHACPGLKTILGKLEIGVKSKRTVAQIE